MHTAPKTTLEDFEKSAVASCFIIDDETGEYQIKLHAEMPPYPSYLIGSVGNAGGNAESFRLLLPVPLAVGNKGTIINLSNTAIRAPYPTFVKQNTNVDGYHVISPYFGAPSFRVGRLMAIAWLPRPAGTTEVDHIDGNPAHDVLENLEWVSHSVNIQRGRHSRPQNWPPEDQVLMVREGYEPLLTHPSKIASIADSQNASHVLRRGTRRSLKGW